MNIGDTVEVLDDTIRGAVIGIRGNEITVLSDEGFELVFPAHELVVLRAEGDLTRSFVAADADTLAKDAPQRRAKPVALSKKEKKVPPMEVDLHIEQLTDSIKNMTPYDMLTLQLETARRQLEFAIEKRLQRVVFIHGVGEGVLRTELEFLLRRYPNVTFYDAEYAKYGVGATEVYIYQKSSQ